MKTHIYLTRQAGRFIISTASRELAWHNRDVSQEFPRQRAATRNFQLGAPRSFHITKDGRQVLFLRSEHGTDAVNTLWMFDLSENCEIQLADPRVLLTQANSDQTIPEAEQARRERMREVTAGITHYSTDESGTQIAFALGGKLYAGTTTDRRFYQLPVTGTIIDPRLSPDGKFIAWSDSKNLFVCHSDGSGQRGLTDEQQDAAHWAIADFIAAEEFGRMRGFWWAPTSDSLLVQRTDESNVATWWISDPAHPTQSARPQPYPAAGTANATVDLFRIDLAGQATHIPWDSHLEYLVDVNWNSGQAPLVTLSNRAQTQFVSYTVHHDELRQVHVINDSQFCERIAGQPCWWDSDLLTVEDNRLNDTRELCLAGQALTPTGVQVLSVLGTTGDCADVVVTLDGISRQLARVNKDGHVHYLTQGSVATATKRVRTAEGDLQVVVESQLDGMHRQFHLMRNDEVLHEFDNFAQTPKVNLRVNIVETGPNRVNTAIIFPSTHVMGSRRLPVLMRPYGGPHGSQVLNSALIFAEDQWFADQGFVVIVADGRGTPGRGPAWERSIYQDFVTPVLDDQIDALTDVAEQFPDDIDPDRVGIVGWSFGGYLAGLAVLERPDIFHAAVAGAPVTEWRWYDTAYTERYLGDPNEFPEVYDHHSLLLKAHQLQRPLMLVHGLADDNVVAAHTLELSTQLLIHGKPHTVLPLSGVTHMTPQEKVSENLMRLTAQFFIEHLQSEPHTSQPIT